MSNRLSIRDATVLVTGATGFIGGRLVDYLAQSGPSELRALVRTYGKAVRLARLPVEMVPGDLLDPPSLQTATAGCDIVFHCAYGAMGDDETRRRVTVEGTRNMLDAAVAAGVKRFVYVSTIAVHGPDPGDPIDEETPWHYTDDVYGDAKIDAEKLVLRYSREKGLPVVILRPTIVYGPRAGGWTLGPVNAMRNGSHRLIEGGIGIANHVYVDDVVQALLLAAVRAEAVGEVFIVSHGTGATWREFFGYYARMLHVDLVDLPLAEIEQKQKWLSQLQNPLNMGLSFVASPHAQSVVRELPIVGSLVGATRKTLPKHVKQAVMDRATAMRAVKLNPPQLPRQWIIDLFCAQGICQIEKAQRLLGYQPQFTLAQGMALTEEWLRYTRVI